MHSLQELEEALEMLGRPFNPKIRVGTQGSVLGSSRTSEFLDRARIGLTESEATTRAMAHYQLAIFSKLARASESKRKKEEERYVLSSSRSAANTIWPEI